MSADQSGGKHAAMDARSLARALIDGVLRHGAPLSELTGPGGVLDRASDPSDRARAQRLATVTLRNLGRADVLLDRYMTRSPPPAALAVLRLAVVELCVEGEAPHGVVDHAVSTLRRIAPRSKLSSMGNAVLRRVAEEGPQVWESLPIPPLPKWLRRRLVHAFDETAVRAIEAAHLAGAPVDLTLKAGLDAQEWAQRLGATVLPTGSLRLTASAQVSALPGYADGAWWVQDAASAIPVRLLAPQPGARVLDLCAAPGGKTLQLASAGAQVTALDRSEARMGRLRENLTRTGLQAELLVADALDPDLDATLGAPFDAIVIDAPCSATGTIRRHPDLPHVKAQTKDRADLDGLFALQSQLIARAAGWLRPGGRMVYCTCSLLPEEGERQAKIARDQLGLRLVPVDWTQPGLDPAWGARDGVGLRLRPDYWPDIGGMDGFFVTTLEKSA